MSGCFTASITAPRSAYFDLKCGLVALLVAASISAKAFAIAADKEATFTLVSAFTSHSQERYRTCAPWLVAWMLYGQSNPRSRRCRCRCGIGDRGLSLGVSS